jgi:cobalt/nickel transport system ATP-binding protein
MTQPPNPPLLAAQGIHFAFANGISVLSGASFELAPQERLAIHGANGAGKSTLLRLLVGLIKPQSGHVIFGNSPCKTEDDFKKLRQRVGFVFQDPDDQLFCPTVQEDIAFGPLNLGKTKAEAHTIVEQTLAHLHLTHLRDRITHTLSGGQKRLVTIATVLAMAPDVLLLDEPTNALDEETQEHLLDILLHLPQAMIIVSHDRHFRNKLATRVLDLKGGVLSAHTTACKNATAPASASA